MLIGKISAKALGLRLRDFFFSLQVLEAEVHFTVILVFVESSGSKLASLLGTPVAFKVAVPRAVEPLLEVTVSVREPALEAERVTGSHRLVGRIGEPNLRHGPFGNASISNAE